MVEGRGFEPLDAISVASRLATEYFKPLSQPSLKWWIDWDLNPGTPFLSPLVFKTNAISQALPPILLRVSCRTRTDKILGLQSSALIHLANDTYNYFYFFPILKF